MDRFTRRKTEVWMYPPLCKYQDEIYNVKEYIEVFNGNSSNNELCIYVHIPFCEASCFFCAFYKEPLKRISYNQRKKLISAYKREIENYAALSFFKECRVRAIHFGGGSPSCIETEFLLDIVSAIRQHFDANACEVISLESNVRDLKNLEKLQELSCAGLKRVSFGVQTFNEAIRKKIGIKATTEDIFQAVETLKKVGIYDYAIDLIYNLPDQTFEDLLLDLEITDRINPAYIDVYNLNVYPNTFFFDLVEKEGYFNIKPSSEREIAMINQIIDYMASRNYNQVLINTFSKKNDKPPLPTQMHMRSRVLGIGPSAKSFLDDMNHKNVPDLNNYIQRIQTDGFAACAGNKAEGHEKYEKELVLFPDNMIIHKESIGDYEYYAPRLQALIDAGYVSFDGENYRLTREGKVWPGNISQFFYSDRQLLKTKKTFLFTIKNNENYYNQDKMGVKKHKERSF